MSNKKSLTKKNQHFEFTYDECINYVLNHIEILKSKKQMKRFCNTHNLDYVMCSYFKNRKLTQKGEQTFLVKYLAALGIKVTEVSTKVFLSLNKDINT